LSSPTVYNGVIYIGARNGYFYAIGESTGAIIGQQFIGYQPVIDGVKTTMVGACNKNGDFYAFDAADISAGPVWTDQIGNYFTVGPGECDAAPVWNGTNLYLASNGTTIDGTAYGGSVREVDPAGGAVIWQTGLAGPIIGTPSQDGAGVIATATYSPQTGQNAVSLLDASTGQILRPSRMPVRTRSASLFSPTTTSSSPASPGDCGRTP